MSERDAPVETVMTAERRRRRLLNWIAVVLGFQLAGELLGSAEEGAGRLLTQMDDDELLETVSLNLDRAVF